MKDSATTLRFLLLVAPLLAGCAYISQSYVERLQPPVTTHRSLGHLAPVLALKVAYVGEGTPNPIRAAQLRERLQRFFIDAAACERIVASSEAAQGTLSIAVHETSDSAWNEFGKDVLTGLTLGAVGSRVTARFDVAMEYSLLSDPQESERSETLRYVVHTVKGTSALASAIPSGAIRMWSRGDAVDVIIQDAMRSFLGSGVPRGGDT